MKYSAVMQRSGSLTYITNYCVCLSSLTCAGSRAALSNQANSSARSTGLVAAVKSSMLSTARTGPLVSNTWVLAVIDPYLPGRLRRNSHMYFALEEPDDSRNISRKVSRLEPGNKFRKRGSISQKLRGIVWIVMLLPLTSVSDVEPRKYGFWVRSPHAKSSISLIKPGTCKYQL